MAQNSNSDDDNDLFRQMMADVKPLAGKKSAESRIAQLKPPPRPKVRPEEPAAPTGRGFIAREQVAPVAAEEHLFFSRGGLQQRLLRRFKRGELRPEARLDLHGRTIAEAGALLAAFLNDSQSAGLRCVCLVHGKGHRSADCRPALKAQVNQWLRDTPEVLAFSSAQARDGGMGALYILLRRPS